MRLAWLCVIVGLTSGCAFVTREVRLEAPEPLVLSMGQPVCVDVEEFADARADPTLVGYVRNGLYLRTADARTEDNVARWISNYLRASIPTSQWCSSTLVLLGRVEHALADSYLNIDGRVVVTLSLRAPTGTVFERQFVGKHSQLAMFDAASEYAQTLRLALQDLGRQAVPQVIQAAELAASAPPP